MKDDFYQKMAQFQQSNQPATLQPTRAGGQNNRITIDDVTARFVSALIFGLIAFMIVITLAIVFNFHWLFALGAGLVTFGYTYFNEMVDAKQYQSPLTAYAQQITEPQPKQVHTITAEVKTPTGLQIAEFDCDPVALREFSGMVNHGKSFSEETAAKAGITQTQFNEIRKQFIKLEWAQWRNPKWPKAGVKLLDAGQAWIEQAGK